MRFALLAVYPMHTNVWPHICHSKIYRIPLPCTVQPSTGFSIAPPSPQKPGILSRSKKKFVPEPMSLGSFLTNETYCIQCYTMIIQCSNNV
jgi:hypothetical protein